MTNWRTQGSKIFYKNQEVFIRGTSLFGIETQDLILNGLDHYSMYDLVNNVKKLGFNSIRVPFSLETIWRWNQIAKQDRIKDPQNKNKTIKQLMLDMAWIMHDLNIILMIDMHRLKIDLPGGKNAITPLWYSNQQGISTQDVINSWEEVALAFKDVPNVIFEIRNEPHQDEEGQSTWGSGNPSTDWNGAAVQISREIAKIKKDTLFVIQGVQQYKDIIHGWGSVIAGYIDHPLPNDLNYVLSAHVYNIGVIPNMWYDPNNTWKDWQKIVGNVADTNKIPILITETGAPTPGTSYEINDPKMCQNAIDFEFGFAYWVSKKNIAGLYNWCCTPFSNDSGSILKQDWDFSKASRHKIESTQKAIPNPTYLQF